MAQVKSGAFTTDSKEGRWLRFDWYVAKQDAEGNYTDINWSLSGGGVSGYVSCCNFKVIIDRATVYEANGWVDVWLNQVVASGTKRIYHNDDGTKTFQASAYVSIYSSGDRSSGVKDFELPSFNRFLDITNLKVLTVDETNAIIQWATSHARDSTYYSLDGGNTWIGSATYSETLTSDQKGGIFTIPNLIAGTSYNLKVKIKKTDSQQWTFDELQFSTYAYPHCTDAPNFTIGDRFTVKFYNPLGRSIKTVGYGADGSQIFAGETVSTSLTGFSTNDANGGANAQYASIPNSTSGTYRLVVRYGDHEEWYGEERSYSIRGDEVPSLGSLSYKDGNTISANITGNNQQIVQNKSHLYVTFGDASAKYGSPILYYVIECNGNSMDIPEYGGTYDFGTVNSSRNVELKLTAYDRRGLSASKSVTVQMLAYEKPTATVELYRLNNYEDETYLTVDGSVSSVADKNTMEIKYQLKESGGSYGGETIIADRTKQTLSLDKNKSYIFRIVVTDRFGETFNKEFVLNKGLFPLFIDTQKYSVGINCFPTASNTLEVNGYDLYNFAMRYEKSHRRIYVDKTGGVTIEVSVANTDKIPIVITGVQNGNSTPVHTIVQFNKSGTTVGVINLGYQYTVTRSGQKIHIDASQYSYLEVKVPLGSEITLTNGAM